MCFYAFKIGFLPFFSKFLNVFFVIIVHNFGESFKRFNDLLCLLIGEVGKLTARLYLPDRYIFGSVIIGIARRAH